MLVVSNLPFWKYAQNLNEERPAYIHLNKVSAIKFLMYAKNILFSLTSWKSWQYKK